MIKELEVIECSPNSAEITCNGQVLAFVDYNKKGVYVTPVFSNSYKQCKTIDEALIYTKKKTEAFLKQILL